jgi:hypothetical protein
VTRTGLDAVGTRRAIAKAAQLLAWRDGWVLARQMLYLGSESGQSGRLGFPERKDLTMKTQVGLIVKKSGIKAGLGGVNHSRKALVVKSGIKAGLGGVNHSRKALVVKSGIKAGLGGVNHSRVALVG